MRSWGPGFCYVKCFSSLFSLNRVRTPVVVFHAPWFLTFRLF